MKKIVLFALLLVSFAGRMMAEEATNTDKVTSSISGNNLSVKLSNSLEYVAFQMDITLGEGLSFKDTDITKSARLTDKNFVLASNCVDNTTNKYRVLAYNLTNASITGTSGDELFSIAFTSAPSLAEPGIDNILFVTASDLKEQTLDYEAADFILGDANSDGDVNVADITAVVAYIYGTTPTNFNINAANVNGDMENGKPAVNVADITGIVSIIYSSNSSNNSNGAKMRGESDSSISIPTVTVFAGSEVHVPVYIQDAESISAFQFDLTLPENIVATGVEQALDNRPGIGGYVSDETYRVMSYSVSNRCFFDSSVPVAYISLVTDENLAPGVYDIMLSSAVVSAQGEAMYPGIANVTIVVVDPTSITNIDAENDKNTQIVSVSGVKVSEKQPKNVYIVNGKKQIEK